MNRPSIANLLELNLALLCISTSAVLGRYIALPVVFIIAFRSLLGGLFLFGFSWITKESFKIKPKSFGVIGLGGVLLGLHWVTYFLSLQYSNIATAMLSLYTFPVITVLLEPLFRKARYEAIHLIFGFLIIVGIFFLTPEFSWQDDYFKGICLGLLSALFYSFRNLTTSQQVKDYNPSVIMTIQLGVTVLLLAPLVYWQGTGNYSSYLWQLIFLSVVTTAIGHTLFVKALRKINVTSSSIISSIQPVYAIILGIIFLQEYPQKNTLIGGAIILFSVVYEAIRVKRGK